MGLESGAEEDPAPWCSSWKLGSWVTTTTMNSIQSKDADYSSGPVFILLSFPSFKTWKLHFYPPYYILLPLFIT